MKAIYLICISFLSQICVAQFSTHPNIVFIILDDMNGYTGYLYGHEQAETPNINALASESIVFTNTYCTSPVCAPSRTSFLSGKDTYYTGVYNNDEYVTPFRQNFTLEKNNSEVITLPEFLKDAGGYFTYSIGKVYQNPNDDYDMETEDDCERKLSWNKRLVISDAPSVLSYIEENNEGFSNLPWGVVPAHLEGDLRDIKAVDSVIDFISDFANGKDVTCNKPFFLSVGLSKPHAEHFVTEENYLPYYLQDFYSEPFDIPYNVPHDTFPFNGVVMPPQPDVPWSDYFALPEMGVARNLAHTIYTEFFEFTDTLSVIPILDTTLTIEERMKILQESKRANMVMAYLACVKYADTQVGKIISELKKYDEVYNNTVIILLSDNGFSLGEKNHWEKAALWETDIRVPLLIKSPCHAPSIINFTTSLLDIFPTVCDITGLEYPAFSNGEKYLDGISLYPLFDNASFYENNRYVVSAVKPYYGEGSCFPQYSVRNSDFHFITYRAGDVALQPECLPDTLYDEKELYHVGMNREEDAHEWYNLAYDAEYLSTITEMKSYLPGQSNYLQKDIFYSEPTDACTVDNFFRTDFILFPNPATNDLFIKSEFALKHATITIFDMQGARVQADSWENEYSEFQLNIENLPRGLYLIKMSDGNTEYSGKFSKM